MTTIKNPELSLNHQQESLERNLNADLQMLIIDAIERGIKNDYTDLKTFAQEKGYNQIAQIKAYLRKNKENLTQETIQQLAQTLDLDTHPLWQQKTREELINILSEKEKAYKKEKSIFETPEAQLAIERIVQKSGISEQTVKSRLQAEIQKRMPNYKILNQGLHYLNAIPLQARNDTEHLSLSQISSLFSNLRRKPTHPLNTQLTKKKQALAKSLAPFLDSNPAAQKISQKQLHNALHNCWEIQHLLQDWSYSTRQKLAPSEETLSARAQQLAELLQHRYSARINYFQDTKMAENYTKLQTMKAEQEKSGIIVEGFESREKIVAKIRENLQARRNTLLTWPSGTGKTEIAKRVVRDLINNMHDTGELSDADYEKYSKNLLYLSGHPDATTTELWGKRVMDNPNATSKETETALETMEKSDPHRNRQLFRYAYSTLEESMRTGIPIIIDEFLRYPEALLATMKFHWSRKPGEKLTLENGEEITIKTVNFIATTNEGEKYGLFASDFINREYESVHVDYLRGSELSDLLRVKLLQKPGYIPYIDQSFFMKNGALHRFITVADKINALRFNGSTETFYDKVDTNGQRKANSKGKLLSAMMDTGRLLKCFDFSASELLRYGAEGALARKICQFIVGASSKESDKYLLIKLFADANLIDKSHETYLMELDHASMHIVDNKGTSVVKQNITTSAQITSAPSQGPTDIAQLAKETPYDKYILSDLPFSNENLSLVAKRAVLKSLKTHFVEEEILNQIEKLESDEKLNDKKIKKLMEAIVPPSSQGLFSIFKSKPTTEELMKRAESTITLLKIPNLNQLFDDQTSYAQWRTDLKKQQSDLIASHPASQKPVASTQTSVSTQQREKALGTITEADLLNKPNMTAEDKKNMQNVIDFMKENPKLRTDKNLKKLYDNVHYHHNAIEISGLNWSRSYRESQKVSPSNPKYTPEKNFQKPRIFYKDETGLQYFNPEAALAEEKDMKKVGQKLPTVSDFEATLMALPGNYKKGAWYIWGNIFHLLFDRANKYTGLCYPDGTLKDKDYYNYLWSSSNDNEAYTRTYGNDKKEGALHRETYLQCHPIRTILQ